MTPLRRFCSKVKGLYFMLYTYFVLLSLSLFLSMPLASTLMCEKGEREKTCFH